MQWCSAARPHFRMLPNRSWYSDRTRHSIRRRSSVCSSVHVSLSADYQHRHEPIEYASLRRCRVLLFSIHLAHVWPDISHLGPGRQHPGTCSHLSPRKPSLGFRVIGWKVTVRAWVIVRIKYGLHPEKIRREHLADLSTLPVRCSHFTFWEI